MASDIRVSFVMPCRNAARWLERSVDSALSQTMDALELVIVDDGSSDDTPRIADRYAAADRRVKVVRQGGMGAAAARNAGRAVARGEWIASLDSDDIAEPTRLERQLALAASDPRLVLIGTGFVQIDEAERPGRVSLYPQHHAGLVRRLERLSGFFPHSSAFFRRDVADRLGGYRPGVGYAEDWDFWLRLGETGSIGCVAEPLLRIRLHAHQMSHDGGGRPQLVHACAAAVAHFLRLGDRTDPIGTDLAEFLAWVEHRMSECGYFDQRQAWQRARARALGAKDRAAGMLGFGLDLVRSGHGAELVGQKLFGNPLPERLAREWAARSGR